MKKLHIIFALLILALQVPILSMNASAVTSGQSSVCEGIGILGPSGDCVEDPDGVTVNSLVRTVISILSYVVGAISVIMIVIGSLKYITSRGDSNSVKSAKDTILYAIIGLVIAVLAQVIVRFVFTRATTPPPCVVTPTNPCTVT